MSSWRALQAAPWNTRLPLAERTRGSWRHDVYSLLQQRGHAGMGSDGLPFGLRGAELCATSGRLPRMHSYRW